METEKMKEEENKKRGEEERGVGMEEFLIKIPT